MTRINTNVSSLNAQKSLARSNIQLQEALTRLSTGLRINVGKDDPAGLIASEALRSDIVSVEAAVANTERANQMIATADSALGQVSALLNDIRGLVTEAANSGALSDDQIAANQLQVDSSLEAINRIAQTTAFQGRRVLDGSLDFITSAGTNFDTVVTDLQIDQANLGATGSMAVSVDVTSGAEKAEITNSAAFTDVGTATATLTFAASATLTLASDDVGDNVTEINIRATSLDSAYDGVTIETVSGGVLNAEYIEGSNKLVLSYDGAADTAGEIVQKIIDTGLFTATTDGAGDVITEADNPAFDTLDQATVQVDALSDGADYNNVSVRLETQNALGATPTVEYDATTKELVITIDDTNATDLTAVADAIDDYEYNGAAIFDATAAAGDGMTTIDPTGADVDAEANTGTTGGALLKGDLLVELSGLLGAEVFSFQQDASLDKIADSINLLSDATGVEATYTGNTLTLNSTQYGEKAFVAASVLSEAATGAFLSGLSTRRDTGADIQALVNGYSAMGDGNSFSVKTATLNMTATVTAGSSTDFAFTITGGGGLFQVGPEVVSNQQARIGIFSVNTGRLGGTSGRLYELGSGEAADLFTDPSTAASIVDEVSSEVASLRGRLGAFQATTLESNINSLNDTLENLTEAESSIRDADFAAETANLTRAQILVQSGVSVLAIANSNPQNILALLR